MDTNSNKQANPQSNADANHLNQQAQQQPINQAQFNELEIIPYEVQQQLAQAAHLRQFQPENLKEPLSRENALMNLNKNHQFKDKNKNLLNKGNYTNLLRTIKPSHLKIFCFLILFIFLKLIFI